MTTESLLIDDFGPLPVFRPATVAEASALIREHASVYPVSGRTALFAGMPPSQPGIALDTRSLNREIDYPHDDMTITVQAGMSVAALNARLAEHGQTLPVDLPLADSATIGGAVAVNAGGPRRYGNGTLRDYVIGISFISDTGNEVKGGGRVVKNVAGYDLMKLHLGAFGSFGLITQLTFKVKPLPESIAAVSWGVDFESIGKTLDIIHTSNSRPVGVELLNAKAAQAAGLKTGKAWALVAFFEEKRITVGSQVTTLCHDLAIDADVIHDSAAAHRLTQLTDLPCRVDCQWSWHYAVRPSELAAALSRDSDDFIHAHAMTGIVWRHSNSHQRPHPTATAWKAPVDRKTRDLVWGPTRSDSALRTLIKQQLDPRGRFNPGRV